MIYIKHEFGNVCDVNPGMCDDLSVFIPSVIRSVLFSMPVSSSVFQDDLILINSIKTQKKAVNRCQDFDQRYLSLSIFRY